MCREAGAASQQWYEFDDSIVTPVEDADVLSREAYILFYAKCDDAALEMRRRVQRMTIEEAKRATLVTTSVLYLLLL